MDVQFHSRLSGCIAALCVSGLSLLTAVDVGAVAQRTFVSATGSDSNACSLAAPCRSFAAALAQTALEGEIIVLDSGGYGAVTISQSVSIIAPTGVYAGISVFSNSPNGTGIAIDSGRVVLRGLSINGQGGLIGIDVINNPIVHIEDCVVSNLDTYGIRISRLTGAPAKVFIDGTMLRDNGSHGVYVSDNASVLHVDHTRIERNGGSGLYAFNGPAVTVTASVLAGNASGAFVVSNNGSKTTLAITDSSISGNSGLGIRGESQSISSRVHLHVARNTIALNGGRGVDSFGVGSTVTTVSDNLVTDNGAIGIFAGNAKTKLTASNNSVSGNAYGFVQYDSALFRTRNNNVVQDNATNAEGTVTSISGD